MLVLSLHAHHKGCLSLLKTVVSDTKIGRSLLVSTLCHKNTKNLANHTRQAAFLEMVALLLMVFTGKCRTVSSVAKALTPVPGGVGPMTVISLMENTVQVFEDQTL